ncbi:16S rRNA (cytosine(1402)-N(4))-methyltransferase RsmH [candidate division WOR-3 bacterium]|nr:16S rRNA (cytosine(1402)-N(4))-methyltransferase RsmH [candidate division WOR-3 bacterium]
MGHKPVLVQEVLSFLNFKEGGIYVDCTLGVGGHTREILKKCEIKNVKCKIYGIDRDEKSLKVAKENLKDFGDRVKFIHTNFRDLKNVIKEKVDGVLFDLGISSAQLDEPERGFSYRFNGPLDMRMNRQGNVPCFKLLEKLGVEDIEFILKNYGEERFSKKIARQIVKVKPQTTQELKDIVTRIISRRYHLKSLARVFQALRIFVNDELSNLKDGLKEACSLLKPRGRTCVISYHSLEDRIVKQYFKKDDSLSIITKKPIRPSEEEISKNPRSRSAKLRCAEKR